MHTEGQKKIPVAIRDLSFVILLFPHHDIGNETFELNWFEWRDHSYVSTSETFCCCSQGILWFHPHRSPLLKEIIETRIELWNG